MNNKRMSFWSWLWILIGAIYFLAPLYATAEFSLRAQKGTLSLLAYQNVISDPKFASSFLFSLYIAVITIVVSVLLVVPTAYWVRLRLPQFRRAFEFIALLPLILPAVVLVFGLSRIYGRYPFQVMIETPLLFIVGNVVFALPYMYRSVDIGLRSIDVHTLTEAAQSLGASLFTILFKVIFPNIMVSLLSGAFLTFAIVMGEFTMASLLVQPAFGPYMNLLSSSKVYEPSAVAILSFLLTWLCTGAIQLLGRRAPGQTQIGGAR
jgi:putative spermidine/putrescine transport system permease protein